MKALVDAEKAMMPYTFTITRRNGDAFVVTVDEEDRKRVEANGPWHVQPSRTQCLYYVIAHADRLDGRRTTILLHRVILHPPPNKQVDHVDGNGLNNTRTNLRLASSAEQMQNKRTYTCHVKKTSEFRGVAWNKVRRKWQAYIRVDEKRQHLGYFVSELEAARAAKKARIHMMPFTNEERHPVP